MEEKTPKLLKQVRWLTQGLILSAAINVGLMTTISYYYFSKKEPATSKSEVVNKERSVLPLSQHLGLVDTIAELKQKKYKELVQELNDETLVEQGYRKRDIALSILVNYHYFNLSAALGGESIQYRQLVFQNEQKTIEGEITLFPGLGENSYKKILSFIKLESWPLTPQGLFLLLKRTKELNRLDSTLADAFYLTPEFRSVERLFQRDKKEVSKESLLQLVISGDWQILIEHLQNQHFDLDLSSQKRQQFLLDYLVRGSQIAAKILVETERVFLIKDLDDDRLALVVPLLNEKGVEERSFVVELLTSPRSDSLWKVAAQRLYFWEGEELTEPYDHLEALSRFVPSELLEKKITGMNKEIIKKDVKEKNTKEGVYIVVSGDSLWKIAHRFSVKIAELRALNALTTDVIKVGQVLFLPESKNNKKEVSELRK
jgi:hypothetical protein